MANKVKVFVGFLALIALFSVITLVGSFRSPSSVSKAANMLKSTLSFEVDQDTDKDGLSNREESYWNTDFENPDSDGDSFLDGEEVASGHDPLIPSPDDIIDNGNLTDKLSNLTLSGLYEGSLKPDSPKFEQSINDLALAVMDAAAESLSSKIDTDFTVVSAGKENQTIYLENTALLFEDMLRKYADELVNSQKYLELIYSDGFNNKNVILYFQNKEREFQNIYHKAFLLNVPRNWVQNHEHLLRLIKNLEISNMAIAKGSDDPIKAAAAFNLLLGDISDNVLMVTNSYISGMESEKLNNQFFNSLKR